LKKEIIYDASILVSGETSGNLHKTGLYRVSYEVLKEMQKDSNLEIYLYDIFQRERELIRYVLPQFINCKHIKVYGTFYRILIFPLGNWADDLRRYSNKNQNSIFKFGAGILKNLFLLIEKGARKAERKWFANARIAKQLLNFKVYYSTYFPIPDFIRLNQNIKKVYTIHDMIPIIHPEWFSSSFNQQLLKEVVDNITLNDKVIAVSHSTKKDILAYRPDLSPEQITVAYLAASDIFYKVEDKDLINQIREKYSIGNNPYLLSVCTFEPRKNLITVIKAFKAILQEGNPNHLKLVLVGSVGWNTSELFKEINDLNRDYNQTIIITGFIPDEDLAPLYSGAELFIYMSLYEGFGLPVLEAIKCGVSVICSNTSSLAEFSDNICYKTKPLDNISLKMVIENNTKMNTTNSTVEIAYSWMNTTEKIKAALNG